MLQRVTRHLFPVLVFAVAFGVASLTPRHATGAAHASAAGAKQPNLVTAKVDFVPGQKTIFVDDFHDMAPGEPPPHWTVRQGAVSLALGGGTRELSGSANLTSPKLSVPANFTVQLDVVSHSGQWEDALDLMNGSETEARVTLHEYAGSIDGYVTVNGRTLGSWGDVKAPKGHLEKFAFWGQKGRVRAYMNGKRLVDANNATVPPFDHVEIESASGVGIRSFRLAASIPDLGAVIEKTGKYVTHGIYFDTGSATLKPTSSGVIKEISAALYKHPKMKLEIDGYTDSTGSAAHNRALSQRRAAAVRSVLISQFGIAKGRLTAKGYGEAHPVATNATKAGRAQNRRVEFVRQGASPGGASGGGGAQAAPAHGAKGASTYPGLPAGQLVKAKWPSGAEMKLKRPEQIAAIFVFDIGDVEGSCHRHANHYCTIAGLVKGVKTKYWGTLRLKKNPLKDPNYRYKLTIVRHSLNPIHVAAIPRKPGLGGWLSVGRGDFPDMYFNPTGPATTKSKKVRSFSTQVELKHG